LKEQSPQTQSLLVRALSWPVLIVCLGFALRIVLLGYYWHASPAPVVDRVPYGFEVGRVARAIAAGEGFSSPLRMVDSGPTVWFTPVYPYLLAGIFKIWGIFTDKSRIIIEILNCAFSALTIIPIYAIAKRTYGTSVAVAASWAWAVFPSALFFAITWIWDTSMTGLVFAIVFWATLAVREVKSNWTWAGYGALWAFGVLVNPSLLSVFPFMIAWLIWEAHKKGLAWPRFVGSALLVFALGMVPWTVRNYVVFHKVIVLRSNFGLELWLGNNPGVPDTWSPWLHPNDDMAEAVKYKQLGEIAYMGEKEHDAVSFMLSHPADTTNFIFRRFVNTWLAVSDSPVDTWSGGPLYVKAFLLFNVALTLLCLVGALFASRAQNPDAMPYAIVLLFFPVVFYLTHSSLRYRFPMDPIMLILATGALAHIFSRMRATVSGVARMSAPLHTHSDN
jgi:hypothetical protein